MSESFHQTIPNLAELKEQYKQRLDAILYKQLTPDNIEVFADEALDLLVELNDEILNQYRSNPNFEPNKPDPLFRDGEQEDDAYKKLELPNIQEILERVVEVRNKIHSLKDYVNQHKEVSDTVITPPQADYHTEIEGGNGQGFEQKVLVPRLLMLLYLLETDLNIQKDEVRIVEGKVPENAIRKHPYIRVEIPKQKRVVYLCDEEDNASYVFDTEKLNEAKLTIEDIDVDDKRDKNSLIATHPGIGVRIIQTKNWRVNMRECIEQGVGTDLNEKEISEFMDKSKLLQFEEFCKEVKDVWSASQDKDKNKSVQKWYRKERLSHKGKWPSESILIQRYQKDGFTDLHSLLGVEKTLGVAEEREYLPYRGFCEDLKITFSKLPRDSVSNVKKWYRKEFSRHNGWPAYSLLTKKYEEDGFINLHQILGREHRIDKELLSYNKFCDEVKFAWLQAGVKEGARTRDWYVVESGKHQDWPGVNNLKKKYSKDGFTTLRDLLGLGHWLKKD